MAAKMLAVTQNINTNKQNQLKIRKETCISNFCCSCVRLLVYRFTYSMLYENIRVKNVFDENILQKFCLFGKKMIWCLALNLKKIALKTTT